MKMKLPLYLRVGFWAAVLALTGCQTQDQPRVLRLALNPDGSTWRLTVNGGDHGEALSSPGLTDQVARLRPRWGDALLLNTPPLSTSSQVEATARWLFHCCESNRVSINLVYGYTGVDMFSVGTYHWVAPFDDPYDLASASFFYEGKSLGSGTKGFGEMLRRIAKDRPGQVFIIGSKYDMGRSFGPNASPFETQSDPLYDVLRRAGTDFIQIDPLP